MENWNVEIAAKGRRLVGIKLQIVIFLRNPNITICYGKGILRKCKGDYRFTKSQKKKEDKPTHVHGGYEDFLPRTKEN